MKKVAAVAGIIVAVLMLQIVPVLTGAEEAKTQQCQKTAENTLTCPNKTAAACCKDADKECCKKAEGECIGEKCENFTGNCAKHADATTGKTCPKAATTNADACPHKAAGCKAAAQVIGQENNTVQKN